MADNETSIKKPPFYIRWFFPILVLLGLIGGAAALWIPSNTGWLRQSGLSGEAEQKSISDLRLHFLYITGGIIAILTLLQTSWKNQVDHRKVEDDIQKNKNDHDRQVHAERRSRYTKAIEQLADEQPVVRLGGVYALTGLADEWIFDPSLNEETRQKEGQIIVNNLCAYIRSDPNNLTNDELESGHLSLDESKIRQTIFKEISSRLNNPTTLKSLWENLDFDFSESPIFYPLNNLKFKNFNFCGSNFYANSSFSNSKFFGKTNFTKSDFFTHTKFDNTQFYGPVDFTSTRFSRPPGPIASFRGISKKFRESADSSIIPKNTNPKNILTDFSNSLFLDEANFNKAHFYRGLIFKSSDFTQEPNFNSSLFTCAEDSIFYPISGATIFHTHKTLTDKSGNTHTREVPVTAQLFDPQSWNSQEERYTCITKD